MSDITGNQVRISLTDEEVEEIYKATGDCVTEVKFNFKKEQAGDSNGDRGSANWSVKAERVNWSVKA
jgi:hypothetical protein